MGLIIYPAFLRVAIVNTKPTQGHKVLSIYSRRDQIKCSETKMMRKWTSFATKSETRLLKINLTICALEGLSTKDKNYTVRVQTEWRFPKKRYLLRTPVQRNCTTSRCVDSSGSVIWDELFEHNYKSKMKDSDSDSSTWKINIEIHGSSVGSNSRILAKLKIDACEFSGLTESSGKIMELPVKCCIGITTFEAKLIVKLNCCKVQNQPINSVVHPLSPTRLLSSCVSFQVQTRSKMEVSDSASESDSEDGEVAEPTYGSITATNLQINEVSDYSEGILRGESKNWNQDDLLTWQAPQKQSLTRLLSRDKSPDYPRDTPLLNKSYGEEYGGDDIDNSRRNFELSRIIQYQLKYEFSDRFEIGKWERRKLKSRDKNLELETEMFLASIDQRSEKVSGGGACTVLATVLADWLHQNPENLPLKCQFDKLIRDGSTEWRNLCLEETHKLNFSDQHFDLDTVLQAKIRPLMVVPEKSYVGFFEFENSPKKLDLLEGVMSFDSIWDEIQYNGSDPKGGIYIVSWNDHFFVLKIDKDAIYIIDTLGERLCEGFNKAYILKFSRESEIYRIINQTERESVCEGESCCKEFIKGFLAALPIRELQCSIEKGLTGETPLHQLLQIEFQFMTQNSRLTQNLEIES